MEDAYKGNKLQLQIPSLYFCHEIKSILSAASILS